MYVHLYMYVVYIHTLHLYCTVSETFQSNNIDTDTHFQLFIICERGTSPAEKKSRQSDASLR